jgi:hypothetical protein
VDIQTKAWVVWAGTAALIALTVAALSAGAASAAFNDSDGDGVIDTIERIAGSDPLNPSSIPENAAAPVYLGIAACTDGLDNDLDTLIDDADPACADTDSDLVDDPTEISLGSDPNDFDSIPEDSRIDAVLISLGFITFQCNDGLDNDLDGLIDDGDPGCAPFDTDADGFGDIDEKTYGSDPNDDASNPEDDRVDPALCTDALDNDGDGLVDAHDDGCLPHATDTPAVTPRNGASPTPARTARPAATSTSTVAAPGLPPVGSGGDRDGLPSAGLSLAGGTLVSACVILALRRERTA